MVVITLTDCPPALRGDLSRWLLEIDTGVFCGAVNARVREAIWHRIGENLKTGRATMVYSSSGEQHMDFEVYNTEWQPVDLDGIKLIRHPPVIRHDHFASQEMKEKKSASFLYSNHPGRSIQWNWHDYCIIDLETSGLNVERDEILEIGLIRVRDNRIATQYHALLRTARHVPEEITRLTGICDDEITREGIEPAKALNEAVNFIGEDVLIGYQVQFDYDFLRNALERYRLPRIRIRHRLDILNIVRQNYTSLDSYKLATVAEYLSVSHKPKHRALDDCLTAYEVYEKLKENYSTH